jgi:hypothetical protein
MLMRGDSPCVDIEEAESGGCCNLGQGSRARVRHGRCRGRVASVNVAALEAAGA